MFECPKLHQDSFHPCPLSSLMTPILNLRDADNRPYRASTCPRYPTNNCGNGQDRKARLWHCQRRGARLSRNRGDTLMAEACTCTSAKRDASHGSSASPSMDADATSAWADFRFLVLTAARSGEARGTTPEEIFALHLSRSPSPPPARTPVAAPFDRPNRPVAPSRIVPHRGRCPDVARVTPSGSRSRSPPRAYYVACTFRVNYSGSVVL